MKNFVFDLYGTLVDIKTDESSPKFIKQMQKRFGKDFPSRYAGLCRLCTPDGEYAEADILPAFKALSVGESPLKAAEFFRKKSRSRLRLYKGARTLLKNLKKAGAGVYLLSNAQSCFTLRELEKLKIKKYFDGILLSSDYGKKKPSPEFFGEAIKRFSLDPTKTIYTGNDFKADILGAKAAGLNTAYIKSNISPKEDDLEKIKPSADFATDSFIKLCNYLLSCISD